MGSKITSKWHGFGVEKVEQRSKYSLKLKSGEKFILLWNKSALETCSAIIHFLGKFFTVIFELKLTKSAMTTDQVLYWLSHFTLKIIFWTAWPKIPQRPFLHDFEPFWCSTLILSKIIRYDTLCEWSLVRIFFWILQFFSHD